jgi:chemotaxis protein methyltransferase CheR
MVGCATGEEVYSLAITLEEEGVLRRASIYATDLNEDALAVARTGAYPLDRVRTYENAYVSSGGGGNLSDHYTVAGRSARFHRNLQSNVTWARHNLVTDAPFNEFHLIICANVLIYFRPSLQERAHRLFFDSLVRSGFLALGKAETLLFSPESSRYQQVRRGVSLFRKSR